MYELLLTGNTGSTADGAMNNTISAVISIVTTIFMWLGVALLVFGLASLGLAFKDDNSEGKVRALQVCLAAIVLISIKWIVKLILNATGGAAANVNVADDLSQLG